MNPFKKKKLTVDTFIKDERVEKIVKKFEASIKDRHISDVIYERNTGEKPYEFVNLVQEGGGVLGIGLVGFTYVLEKNNIRFLRLAGTSAGAINTMLLAAVKGKLDCKSETILEYLVEKDMEEFVDGYGFVLWLINKLVIRPGDIKSTFLGIATLALVTTISLILNLFHSHYFFTVFCFIAIGILLLNLIYGLFLISKFKNSDWSLCRGEDFHNWLKVILKKNKITTTKELKDRAFKDHDDLSLSLRSGADLQGQSLNSDVTVISCDITSRRKVEFPHDMIEYVENVDAIHPADYVRASMSIPFFFEPFKLKNKQGDDISFVDGGVISNFPVNIFHNPNLKTPRLPVIAVELDSGTSSSSRSDNSLIGRAYTIFNTVQKHSDQDFFEKNKFYKEKCVAPIDVKGFNWLNFSMSNKEKVELFIRGAQAALKWVESYDWIEYKRLRKELYKS